MQTLRLFTDVARYRSFSHAAELHGITQSAVSQRVGNLEKRLGMMLINRSVRPLTLTDAGRQFFTGCEDIIERYDRLETKIATMTSAPSGSVRVAAIYSSGIELLNRIREDFIKAWPQINIEITYEKPDNVYQLVVNQSCDLGILSYPDHWRKVGVIPLRDEAMAVVCSPGHELAKHKSIQADRLTSYAMVTFTTDLPAGRHIRAYLRDAGAGPKITDTFDNVDTIKSAVEVTDRFTILPARTVQREVSGGMLAVVELQPPLARPMGIIHRKRNRQNELFSPATQVFVNYLIDHAGHGAGENLMIRQQYQQLAGA